MRNTNVEASCFQRAVMGSYLGKSLVGAKKRVASGGTFTKTPRDRRGLVGPGTSWRRGEWRPGLKGLKSGQVIPPAFGQQDPPTCGEKNVHSRKGEMLWVAASIRSQGMDHGDFNGS